MHDFEKKACGAFRQLLEDKLAHATELIALADKGEINLGETRDFWLEQIHTARSALTRLAILRDAAHVEPSAK